MSIGNITATDPLANALGDRERELFKQLSKTCGEGGFTPQQVSEAALNLLCNAIRQSFPLRQQAERQYDDMVARMKAVLLERHYDAVTSRRKSVFAFDQTVDMPLTNAGDIFHQ